MRLLPKLRVGSSHLVSRCRNWWATRVESLGLGGALPFLCRAGFLGLVAAGCGQSASTANDGVGGVTAGKGGGPAAGGGDAKGGSGGNQPSGGGGANTAAASGRDPDGGTGGAAAPEDDCRVTGCEDGLTCVPSEGVCATAGPTACVDVDAVTCVDRPVCGCDGEVYESNCAALLAGSSIAPVSLCSAPDGMIECINAYCEATTEYCDLRRHYGPSSLPIPCDQGPAFSSGVCHPLPAGCGSDATCACISEEPFEDCPTTPSCSDAANGLARACLSGCYG